MSIKHECANCGEHFNLNEIVQVVIIQIDFSKKKDEPTITNNYCQKCHRKFMETIEDTF